MALKDQLNIDTLHHAYLIEGERVNIFSELTELFDTMGIARSANPDLHWYEYDAFLIDHAHELRRMQSLHALGTHKLFIVAFHTIMSEAQNALLKTLEEPTEGTHFFFVTRHKEILFPTLRSRMQIIGRVDTLGGKEQNGGVGDAFLRASIPDRLAMIETFTKAKADGKAEAKERARVFLESFEHALLVRIKSEGVAATLEDVIAAKRYLSDRAPSLKLLLEHLALTTPIFAA